MLMKLFFSMTAALVALMLVKTVYYGIAYGIFVLKYNVLKMDYKPSGEALHYYKVIDEEKEREKARLKALVKYDEEGYELINDED